MLGGRRFIKEAFRRVKEEHLQKEDISYRRALKPSSISEQIADRICLHFDVPRDDIFNKKGQYRNIAIYLLKKYTALTNNQIGQLFGNMSYSAVTRVVQRFEQKIKKDKELKKRIGSIKADLSNVKGWPLSLQLFGSRLALTRNLPTFSKFLQSAAISNEKAVISISCRISKILINLGSGLAICLMY